MKVVEEEGLKGRILKKLTWSIPQVAGGNLPHHHRQQQQQPPFPVLHHYPPPSSPPHFMSHRQPSAVATTPDSAGRALRQLPLTLGRGAPLQQGNDGEDHPGKQAHHEHCRHPPRPADVIHVDELVRHIRNSEAEDVSCPVDGKENTRPTPPPPRVYPSAAKDDTAGASLQDTAPLISVPKEDGSTGSPPASTRGQLDVSSSYRRPDFNSYSLFDPDLLAAFRRAVMEHALACEELCRKAKSATEEEEEAQERGEDKGGERLHGKDDDEEGQEPPCKVPRTDNGDEHNDEEADPLRGFELRCPPGGEGAVVLYTTSLRGIRKTFEDCNNVRFLLQRLRVGFYDRDVSMHLDYRDELWNVLGGRAVPPRLFIRGRYIGGADEVLCLHEQGRLLPLMRGIPVDRSGGVPCRECSGARFVMCGECSGSRKVYYNGGEGGGSDQAVSRCPHCNENGLVVCTLCCCRR
ncbi:hypothetical protein Taro_037756 [Colocasia esculenta]|uniref:Glutaredoxin domain-containing protein n=1 Tax=Colocasia esculenta TaxID=4460 RepID=A0A843WDS2_COLES|nr:hypothetical protein [Colocasia esculenta]